MKKFKFALLTVPLLVVAACGGSDEAESNEEEADSTEIEDTDDSETDDNDESAIEPEDIDEDADEEEATEPTAVSPNDNEDTVEFTRVNWMLGSPDREASAGIWLYTEDDHPSEFSDTFDFHEEDVLLYQIGDEEYEGYEFRAQHIIIEDEDTARIIVAVHDEPDEDAEPEDLEMPRQFLRVDHEVLRDKGFIVEKEDGETLSLE